MFTGIVQESGRVIYFSQYQKSENLRVKSKTISQSVKIGDSVSVNGACLTVVRIQSEILSFDVLQETAQLTNIGLLSVGDQVNLEDSLRVDAKISGHFVTGHIDCVGRIKKRSILNKDEYFEISFPQKFSALIVPKGSVALDGISLTIREAFSDYFSINIIPHTLKHTTLAVKATGNKVNIEFDILAKYASKLIPR